MSIFTASVLNFLLKTISTLPRLGSYIPFVKHELQFLHHIILQLYKGFIRHANITHKLYCLPVKVSYIYYVRILSNASQVCIKNHIITWNVMCNTDDLKRIVQAIKFIHAWSQFKLMTHVRPNSNYPFVPSKSNLGKEGFF